jgi:Ca-activated chloride channel homolog
LPQEYAAQARVLLMAPPLLSNEPEPTGHCTGEKTSSGWGKVSMSTSHKSDASKSFSIFVIILILLAIMAILAGLLLPSLAKAKAKAQRISIKVGQLLQADLASSASRYGFNTEAYDRLVDNPFLATRDNPLSTFGIDVDTASYSNIRRFVADGQLPPKDAVRIEEMLNYFRYRYPEPADEHPFSVTLDATECPWNKEHQLVRIGLKAGDVASAKRSPCNLVFLIDVSGSMESPNKLPLVQNALELLVNQLADADRVAIVVYAGSSGLVLDSTSCVDRKAILRAIKRLRAGGSTDGGGGITLAYATAMTHFIKGGVNRVILCTDGDFNVGVTSVGDLTRLITAKARSGVFLTVLGFGMGNYKDATLEKLADLGNGNYGYIDGLKEARKLFVEQLNGTLVTVAKDVKIQVEFNPARVSAYRLIGYENRLLRKEDFNDDSKDAGEIGAGHTVTALYEVVQHGDAITLPAVDPLKYQTQPSVISESSELLTVKLRYKQPDGETSKLLSVAYLLRPDLAEPNGDLKFASAVAAFGMLLRDSEHRGNATFELVLRLAGESKDGSEYRDEFIELVKTAKKLAKPSGTDSVGSGCGNGTPRQVASRSPHSSRAELGRFESLINTDLR